MPGTKNPTAPQSTNTTLAMQAYPTMTIPAEIAHQFTCRCGSEGIVTLISRTLRKTGDRRSSTQFELWCRPEWSCPPRQGARHHNRGGDHRTDPASHRGLIQPQRRPRNKRKYSPRRRLQGRVRRAGQERRRGPGSRGPVGSLVVATRWFTKLLVGVRRRSRQPQKAPNLLLRSNGVLRLAQRLCNKEKSPTFAGLLVARSAGLEPATF